MNFSKSLINADTIFQIFMCQNCNYFNIFATFWAFLLYGITIYIYFLVAAPTYRGIYLREATYCQQSTEVRHNFEYFFDLFLWVGKFDKWCVLVLEGKASNISYPHLVSYVLQWSIPNFLFLLTADPVQLTASGCKRLNYFSSKHSSFTSHSFLFIYLFYLFTFNF